MSSSERNNVAVDMSSSASVTSAASSVASSASPPLTLSIQARGEERGAVMSIHFGDSGSIVGGEVHPPAVFATDISVTSSGSSDHMVERINPFEQADAVYQSTRSVGSHSSRTDSVIATTSNPRPMTERRNPANSPDRSSTANIDNITSSNHSSPLRNSETRTQSTPQRVVTHVSFPQSQQQQQQGDYLMEDDETEPSSAVTSAQDPGSSGDGQEENSTLGSDPNGQNRASIRNLVESTRRMIGSTRKDQDPAEAAPDVDDDLLGDTLSGTLICGYLQKLGRNGKWQTRWFETDGESLSYYKNEKRTKLLATLDLEKVGSIEIDPEDSQGVSFNIQVLGRLYHLRTVNRASCKDWVITLNRVKEARMQQGNVKLISLPYRQPVDLLDTPAHGDDLVAPRVVVLANRQRTRAVEEAQDLNHFIQLEENAQSTTTPRKDGKYKSEKRLSAMGSVVLARWTKRRSSLSRLRSKLAKWARSLRELSCKSNAAILGLDTHVHPPGHDDRKRNSKHGDFPRTPVPSASAQKKQQESLSGWISKEATVSSRSPVPVVMAPSDHTDEDVLEPRHRKNSTASEDIRVLS